MTSIPPQPAPPAKSRKKLFGGLLMGCGCLFFILAIILLVCWYLAKKAESTLQQIESTTTTSLQPATSGDDQKEASGDTKSYANSREGRTGSLADSYVDFHFDYPASWSISPQEPSSSNFVTVVRSPSDGTPTENLSVGYFQGTGVEASDKFLSPQLMTRFYAQLSQQFNGLEKVSEGPGKVGRYDAYQGVFRGKMPNAEKAVDVFLKVALVRNPEMGERNGVSMLMFATSAVSDITGPEDVGVRGEIPVILDSFRFGR